MSKLSLKSSPTGTGTFTIEAPAGNTDRTLVLPDTSATLITDSAGILNIGSGQIYKDASGNVGIGTGSPAVELTVAGRISYIGETTDTGFEARNIGGNVGTFLDFDMPDVSTADATVRFFRRTNTTGRKRVWFLRGDNTSTTDAQIGVDGENSYFNSGNVGIGTSSPIDILQIRPASLPQVCIGWNQSKSATRQPVGRIGFTTHFGSQISASIDGVEEGSATDFSRAGLTFNTRLASGSLTERMRIDSGGAVFFPGVGTTASAANAFLNSASSPANQLLRSTSSIRYKTDIETLESERADNLILNARPVWYRSLAEADRKEWGWYGLIAEEVAEIEPRLVHWSYAESDYEEVVIEAEERDEEGAVTKEARTERQLKADAELKPDGVQYDRLTVMLLDVVKRQQQAIEQLQADVAALKGATE